MFLVFTLGFFSALSNGFYGHVYEPLVRNNNNRGVEAFIPPILLYFIAGSVITFIGLIGSFFFSSWHIQGMTWKQGGFFVLMVIGYATHIVTEAIARQKIDMTVYTVFFQTQTIFLVLINVLIGTAVATGLTWVWVVVLVSAGVLMVAQKNTWRHLNKSLFLAIASALARAVAFTIDGFLATEVLNWWVYEGFTFLIPSLTVFTMVVVLNYSRIRPYEMAQACFAVVKTRVRGYALASGWSGLEFLFGVGSMNMATNRTFPSAIQGIVPVVSLVVESLFHPHRIRPRIILGALLATIALIGIVLTS